MCLLFWKKKKKNQISAANDSNHKKDNAPTVKTENTTENKEAKNQKYHISQNKEKDAKFFMKWRVRKEGSEKTIQYFDTQKLAIDFAQNLANRAGTTAVIHKLDGSIRKQDYGNKES